MADDLVEAFGEDLAQTRALQRVSETRIERVDVARQLALTPQVVHRVFVSREDVFRLDVHALRDAGQKFARLPLSDRIVLVLAREQRGVGPNRLSVFAPEQVQ